ncbi:hypothetical protein FRB95_001221 [Tulasnella sp. JGI-2019a]|nr:hypothetical protein FRB95_001221 [Tulasnella sp. JGI-2019a]
MAKLFRTLRTRPDLARNIITFDGSLYPAPYKAQYPSPFLVRHWCRKWSIKRQERKLSGMIVASVQHMVNVTSLTLHDFRWLGTPYQTRVRNAIYSSISLTTLAIQGRDFFQPGSHSDCDFQLCMILRHQPLLERLELRSGDWDPGQWILPTDIPHLTHLMARPEEAKYLVPGRPVASLALRKMLTLPGEDIWEALTASTSPIHTLKVDIFDLQVVLPFLHLLSVHLQDLQDLALDGASYESLPMLTQGFPSFRSLRTLHLTIWVRWGRKQNRAGAALNMDRRRDLVTRVQLECPQFQSFDYSHRGCGFLL